VDIVTHGLASLAVARGLFPRAGKLAIAGAVLVGCLPDIDWIATFFGPSAALTFRDTYLHSILGAILIAILPLSVLALTMASTATSNGAVFANVGKLKEGELFPEEPSAVRRLFLRRVGAYFVVLPLCAALLHFAMDACQSGGVMLLWPFSSKRFAADWLPPLDFWILAILIAAIALPELLRLVSSEIGAKSRKPRGRTGALIGLALIVVYVGVRGTLHSNVAALLESRSFHGEPARRVAAYPEPLSLATWHGVVETESALNQIDVNAFSTANFDADASLRIYKPEASPLLNSARNTRTAQHFLAVAQIPKASVEKTDVGYVVILRDLCYAAAGETSREIAALIELDPDSKVTSEELVWARDLRR